MSYKEKPQIKLYAYTNSSFTLQALIDDYQECSFEHNRFNAGQFTITINYNIPNALLFERGLWVQFSNNPYDFGEIINVTDSIGTDSIGQDGKGSQIRTITGYDARYIFKRRVIKNLNNNDTWSMTAKGELCMRNLILDQCGSNAEEKRRLPVINTIPASENAIGKVYSVSESFSNLYEVLTTIATQSEIGWRINFDGNNLALEFYSGTDRSATVRFDTDYESLAYGKFTDSAESFANSVYVAGKGEGSERDLFEGENLIDSSSPSGLDRFESYDNQSSMTTEAEYEAEALSMLSQYGQTLQVSGNGLAKCPYEFRSEYEVGDIITIAFSGKSAVVQILAVTEHWAWGAYNLEFSFGKPQPDLSKQMQLMLKQIQKASKNAVATESVKWYTTPTETEMASEDVTFNTLGFTGSGGTFTLYRDSEKTGSKNYKIYAKNLTGNLTLTTGVSGKSNAVINSGNIVASIYVDDEGNVILDSQTATSSVERGNNQPVTSGGVADAIQGVTSLPTDAVLHYSFDEVPDYPDGTADVRLLANNTYDIQSTNYAFGNNGGSTRSNNNGNLQVDIVGGTSTGVTINNTYISGKILKFKLKVTALTGIINILNGISTIVQTIRSIGTYEICYLHSNAEATYKNLYILCNGIGNSCTFTVEQVYIGDGSYSTPIIDNANGQNNATNNGGIAVQGVSGKGVYLPQRKSVRTNFNLTPDFSISIWVKPDNADIGLNGLLIYKADQIVLRNGISGNNYLLFSLFDSNNKLIANAVGVSGLLPAKVWTNIIIVRNGTNCKIYLNGVVALSLALANNTISSNTNEFIVGSASTQRPYIVDDYLVFDRALSDTEVQALYQNKANTPKYYSWADWKLSQV